MTRPVEEARIEQAHLRLVRDTRQTLRAESPLGISYGLDRTAFVPSLRTGIGLPRMNITGQHDYLAVERYRGFARVRAGAGHTAERNWSEFFDAVKREAKAIESRLVTVHRINPYSPSTKLFSFFSQDKLSASNVLNIVMEEDVERAKATCVILNSAAFWANFFLLKEESTGRYINVRFYDMYEMALAPPGEAVGRLARIFDSYSEEEFPALRLQFDGGFDARYDEYQAQLASPQVARLFSVLEQPVRPAPVRLRFDRDVARALRVRITNAELRELYAVLVQEMIITRGLTRD